MAVGYQLTWSSSSTNLAVGETIQAATYNYGPNINTINTLLNGIATATDTNGGIELTGVAAGTVSIPAGTSVGNSVTTSNATTITVTAPVEDESYLNKRGLTHFWENIDDIKQDKLTAGTNISINNNTISSSQPVATTSSLGVVQVGSGLSISSGGVLSATGGGVADSVAWGHVTGTLADQTDLQNALDAKADSSSLATVATSGSYNDLTNKPTIGNATLTIQKNGTAVDTFTANATTNKSINITVPTTAADVSALPASTKYGASIAVSINTTDYKVTTTLKDQDGNTLGTAQVIDLPLESVVVNGSYDSTNKKIVLTLQNGNTIDIPVADLVAGLQSEITSSNKLASDLVDDTNQTNKFVTAAEKTKLAGIAAGAEVNQNAFSNVKVGSTTVAADSKTDTLELVAGSNVTLTPDATNDKVTIAATDTTYSDATTSASGLMSASDKTKLNGIASGAEVNVQSDWTQTTTTADDYIKNKPTIPTKTSDLTNDSNFVSDANYVHTDNNYTTADKNKLSGIAAGAEVNVQANWTQTTTTADDYIKNKPTLATVATSGSYNDLLDKPTLSDEIFFINVISFSGSDGTYTITVDKTYSEIMSAYQDGKVLIVCADVNSVPDSSFPASSVDYVYAELYHVEENETGGSTTTSFFFSAGETSGNGRSITAHSHIFVIGDQYASYNRYFGSIMVTDLVSNVTNPVSSSAVYNALTAKANSADLATVATSGSYNDLSNKPTIPTVNNATLTIQKNGTTVKTFTANASSNVTANITVPINVSDLTNDAGYLTSVAWGDVTNKPTFATVATSGSYNDLSNKPTIPAAQVNSDWDAASGVAQILNKPTLATVATSGSYNDLSNKPTIPTVNNATLTIQKNGTDVATFTANASSNATANISVPTNTSDLNNDSNFVASTSLATVATSGLYSDLTGTPTIPAAQIQSDWTQADNTKLDYIKNKPSIPTATSDLNNDSGFVSSPIQTNDIDNGAVTSAKIDWTSITPEAITVSDYINFSVGSGTATGYKIGPLVVISFDRTNVNVVSGEKQIGTCTSKVAFSVYGAGRAATSGDAIPATFVAITSGAFRCHTTASRLNCAGTIWLIDNS